MKQNIHPLFLPKQEFGKTLEKRVGDYFRINNISTKGNWILYLKAIILLTLLPTFYWIVFIYGLPWWLQIPFGVILGCVIASIGFNIAHDAVHNSFSKIKWVNNLFGFSFNLVGVVKFLWKKKHNFLHHIYTNILHHDEDIEAGPLLRMHPNAPWRPIHQYQHRYAVPLYSGLYFHWIFFSDFKKMITGKILGHKIQNITAAEIAKFVITKAWYVFAFIWVPIYFSGFSVWVVGFVSMQVSCSTYIAVVFQLAHLVQGVKQSSEEEVSENEAMIHQVETTANFATKNKLVSWLVGGLNFQIEHHLFHRYSHVHYPAISKIVKSTCEEFGVSYLEFPSVKAAFVSHLRRFKELGQKPNN
jgi:linoleoyl-CoA desaturase